MKRILLSLLSAAVGVFMAQAAMEYAIVPAPAQVDYAQGTYTLRKADPAKAAKLRTDRNMAPEAYTLQVTPSAITITAADGRGHFYGLQTLRQIAMQSADGQIQALTITDYPKYEYRGVMLDVARCYLPKDEILRIVDAAAMLKLNRLHLHLTDDNGWRMEIKKYPKLTEVGAWRVDRPGIFPGRLNARSASEPATYGGYYTQKELREIVAYAAKRQITVIPEIEMPAHAAACIASYPELACPVVDKFVGVFPGIGGKDASIIMCAGNEAVYSFIQDVLDEVMDVFPSEYIHLGGDEANKAMWEKCPLCNERIAAEGLHDHEELQAYFMDRINHYLIQKGRKSIGWDEVTYGNPKEDMVIMGWQGDGSVAVKDALKSGRRFVMTPARALYLIRYQGPQWFEPFTYFGNNTLADIFNFQPLKDDVAEQLKDQLWGVQGSLFTEFCREPADVQYLMFPRLLAVADLAWRQPEQKDWERFLRGVDMIVPVLESQGIVVAKSMYNLDHKVCADGQGGLSVTLGSMRPDMEVRYSVGDASFGQAYTADGISISGPATVFATSFKDGKQMGQTLQLPLAFNKATACKIEATDCRNGLAYTLTNGLRATEKNTDGEWAGWYNANAVFSVDLGKRQDINEVKLGTLTHSDICIAAPLCMYVYVSDNGLAWRLVKTIDVDQELVFHPTVKIVDLTTGPIAESGRYVKCVAINPGCIPDEMAREGTPTWMYFDEIQVN